VVDPQNGQAEATLTLPGAEAAWARCALPLQHRFEPFPWVDDRLVEGEPVRTFEQVVVLTSAP